MRWLTFDGPTHPGLVRDLVLRLVRLEAQIEDVELVPAIYLKRHSAIRADTKPTSLRSILGLVADRTVLVRPVPYNFEVGVAIRGFVDHRLPRIHQEVGLDRRKFTNREPDSFQPTPAVGLDRLPAGAVDLQCDTHLVHPVSITGLPDLRLPLRKRGKGEREPAQISPLAALGRNDRLGRACRQKAVIPTGGT